LIIFWRLSLQLEWCSELPVAGDLVLFERHPQQPKIFGESVNFTSRGFAGALDDKAQCLIHASNPNF